MRGFRIALVLGVLTLLSISSYPGADLVAFASTLARTPAANPRAAPGDLPWLHVEHPGKGEIPYIADEHGRMVLLRGTAVTGLMDLWSGTSFSFTAPTPRYPIDPAVYDFGCPQNTDQIKTPPLCKNDFAEMAGLGFNVVRLALSWSLLEPRPGEYSAVYLSRIAQVVEWARQNGIYVLLDMHQDAYSRYIPRPEAPPLPGGRTVALNDHDGAPEWAVFTDFLPSERYIGQREMNPAVNQAFSSFWLNRPVPAPGGAAPGTGLQDHYIGAIAELARRFLDNSAVLGFNVFNEPWPGWVGPPLFEDLFLLPFYRRVIDAVTGARDGLPCPAFIPANPACGYPDLNVHDRAHIFMLEAEHLRSLVDFQTSAGLRVSSYPNVAYAIHTYTHKFTLDALFKIFKGYPPGGYEQSYRDAVLEAKAIGAALFVDEFGNEPDADRAQLAAQLDQQERFLTGSTYWPWKENCAYGSLPWGVYEGIADDSGGSNGAACAYDRAGASRPETRLNGCLRPGKEQLLARVYPMAISGARPAYDYDPQTGAFKMTATGTTGDRPETLVMVPPEVSGTASVAGDAVLAAVDVRADGGRLLHVATHAGPYSVQVAPAPLRLATCPS